MTAGASESMVLTEGEAVELLAFLITAARIQFDEPAEYGCIRLLTAAERLSRFAMERASPAARAMLGSAATQIPQMHGRMSDREDYLARLDGLCRAVAQHLVERAGLDGESP